MTHITSQYDYLFPKIGRHEKMHHISFQEIWPNQKGCARFIPYRYCRGCDLTSGLGIRKSSIWALGVEAAQVTIALQVFVLLVMTAVGIGLGYLVDWAIRRRRSIFHSPPEGGCAEALVRLWGYEMTCQEEVEYTMIPEINLFPTFDEVLNMVNRPKRRGRKPTFPLEAWLPIAAKWENRDPIRDAFTLEDLIRESLGENSDGSPIVSAQSYYSTWRERALDELQAPG